MTPHDAARLVGQAVGRENEPRAEARIAADLVRAKPPRVECPNCHDGSLNFDAGCWACDACEYDRYPGDDEPNDNPND